MNRFFLTLYHDAGWFEITIGVIIKKYDKIQPVFIVNFFKMKKI